MFSHSTTNEARVTEISIKYASIDSILPLHTMFFLNVIWGFMQIYNLSLVTH